VEKALEKRKAGAREVYRFMLKKKIGDCVWLLVGAAPLYKDNEYLGALGLASDATRLICAERDLQEANAEITVFLDVICHDINNINQAAMGYLEIARQTMDEEGGLDIGRESLITKPLEALQGASKLIANVRMLQRVTTEKERLEPINLGELITDVVREFSSMPGKHIDINLRKLTRCTVMANVLLREAFFNIVGNSVKHSKGPLAVDITMQRTRKNNMGYCKVAIEDNGPGIPDEKKAILFDPETPPKQRDGMGLYLVTTIVSEFNGRVLAEDRVPGDYTKGLRVIVLLPAAKK
jgi:signal transduction histidine kinase